MNPNHIVEDNLLYSASTDLNLNHVFKILLLSGLVFDKIAGY